MAVNSDLKISLPTVQFITSVVHCTIGQLVSVCPSVLPSPPLPGGEKGKVTTHT